MEIDLRGSRRSGGQRLHVLFALFDWTRAWAFQDCRSRIHSVKQRGDGAGFAEPRASHYITLCARERLPCSTSSIPPRVRFLYDPNASAMHSLIGNHGRIEAIRGAPFHREKAVRDLSISLLFYLPRRTPCTKMIAGNVAVKAQKKVSRPISTAVPR